MRGRTFSIIAACALAAASVGCGRKTVDRVEQGAQGAVSPAESGEHGSNRLPYGGDRNQADAEHQTAGLTPEMTNGKVDDTMEGSGNLAWQGSYEREKRTKAKAQAQ